VVISDARAVAITDPARRLPRANHLDAAVIVAIAYADVYGWPLTTDEVHRFLPLSARRDAVAAALASARLSRVVSHVDGYHVLRGRELLVAERSRREAASQRLWSEVRRRGRLLARIPWVRMVAVSGSLAVSAAQDGDDIDLFVVTDDGRLWLSRALTIAAGRLSGRATLCPNYLVTDSAVELSERDLYTAHELVQLVPLFGADTYAALLERNRWYREFLPNHPGYTGTIAARPPRTRSRIGGGLVSRVERWEMQRKVTRLGATASGVETRFDHTTCKGHVDGHRRRFWSAFAARMDQLEAWAR
jgi:hypothetical protein